MFNFTPKSQLHIDILREAAEFVYNFEGDLCLEEAQTLASYKGINGNWIKFDKCLATINDLRLSVRAAHSSSLALMSAQVGDATHFNHHNIIALHKGLEFMQDQLNNEVTGVFYHPDFKNGTDAAGVVKIRETVELALDRLDASKELLEVFGRASHTV